MTKALKHHINHMNALNELFGRPTIDIGNITAADAQSIFNNIDGALSPENLTCDGELDRAEVDVRYNNLMEAAADLRSMGFVPLNCYEL